MKNCFCKITTVVCLIAPLVGFAQGVRLLTTFTNPVPARSVAALGPDRLVIGAPDSTEDGDGVAYLLSTNGTVLATFPSGGDRYGYSVAALGTDRVVVGDYDDSQPTAAGWVHLFSTNGARLTLITNPVPTTSHFGIAVAGVASDAILVGAEASFGSGAAYLFNTNGVLVTTFSNPTLVPGDDDSFGQSVVAFGSGRVLIGAQNYSTSPAAYLFSTNGTLLATFTNPSPAQLFSTRALASVGTDRVLVGVHLFDTNGVLLTAFTNAAVSVAGTVAVVGSERVLVGAPYSDTGATNAGVANLFSTSGALLTTLTNPAPTAQDGFGYFVTALGNDRVLIGPGTARFICSASNPSLPASR